mmetsp:Transcript_3875/g.12633  ORF Transcript_3875/g.12633 Transcript_3875/m.12633 type:complete len:100 (+) Transcript_3875:648-947(+)
MPPRKEQKNERTGTNYSFSKCKGSDKKSRKSKVVTLFITYVVWRGREGKESKEEGPSSDLWDDFFRLQVSGFLCGSIRPKKTEGGRKQQCFFYKTYSSM